MKHIPNKILALILAASGALFAEPAAAFLQYACVKNDMRQGTLMGARVHFKHYYQAKSITDTGGKWRWRSSKTGPIVGKGKTSCVKLWRNSRYHVKRDTHFWVEAVTLGLLKRYRNSCGGLNKDEDSRVPKSVIYTIKGSILTKTRTCAWPEYTSRRHLHVCDKCRIGEL